MICNLDRSYSGNSSMNIILSVILLWISGVSCRYLQCPESDGKFPVENSDCKSYYECENWRVTNEMTCPVGQNFNPSLQWCDYEELYYCVEKEIEKYKRCKKSSGRFPKKNSSCRGYYECQNWQVTGEFTCPRGQNFNPEQQWCDWEELYPCLEDKPSEKCPKPDGLFLKLGSQCKSYYRCINGKASELQCPGDQIFDNVNKKCEWPEIYSCDETSGRTTVETTRVTYTTTQPTSSTEETSSSTETVKTTASTQRTKSTAETRTTSSTNSVPTKDISQSTKTERTTETTPTQSSRKTETESTHTHTVSSTEGSSGTRTRGTGDDYTTAPTKETSPYTHPETTVETTTLSTGGTSFGTETSQSIISNSSTARTNPVIDTFSTASIPTHGPGELVCPSANGLFPHPTDETKFLSCLNFIPTVMNCPEDLIYQPTLKACVWRRMSCPDGLIYDPAADACVWSRSIRM